MTDQDLSERMDGRKRGSSDVKIFEELKMFLFVLLFKFSLKIFDFETTDSC